jgi:myo-inositol-1(or 4)-monophosphatase
MSQHHEFLQAASLAADGAAQILLNFFGNLHDVSEKEQAGLVSEADRESESFILSTLKKKFPDHRFLGEESGLSDGLKSPAKAPDQAARDFLWLIDPLDGTTNYVHQFPVFCISIAVQVDGELIVGLVDAPKMGLRFHAVKGEGAYLNGKRIRVSARGRFEDGLFATGFAPTHDQTGLDEQFELIADTICNARGIRRAGAAALDLCFVAQGVFDVFWERNLQPWDMAAGALIVREAGGVVTNFEGAPYTTKDRHIVAGSPALHARILERYRKIHARRQPKA